MARPADRRPARNESPVGPAAAGGVAPPQLALPVGRFQHERPGPARCAPRVLEDVEEVLTGVLDAVTSAPGSTVSVLLGSAWAHIAILSQPWRSWRMAPSYGYGFLAISK